MLFNSRNLRRINLTDFEVSYMSLESYYILRYYSYALETYYILRYNIQSLFKQDILMSLKWRLITKMYV